MLLSTTPVFAHLPWAPWGPCPTPPRSAHSSSSYRERRDSLGLLPEEYVVLCDRRNLFLGCFF